ncbi:MAG: hypothetical protein DRP96_10760 [Candidatus Neomarinimicrobiota bacterium]|nr:MAG: hypothetical protein DRP96_10760 [Candidatus Neomarinimicrobiota bacterium]
MDSVKRNIVLITILGLAIPAVFAIRYRHHTDNSWYTVQQNMRNLQEEVQTIRSINHDVLAKLDLSEQPDKEQAGILSVDVPSNIRDPFVFPDELILEKAKHYAATQKTTNRKRKKPKQEQEKPKTVLKLAGIIYDKVNPMAIINDEIYKVKDQIGEYTITAINEKGVTLTSKKGRLFLKTPVIE